MTINIIISPHIDNGMSIKSPPELRYGSSKTSIKSLFVGYYWSGKGDGWTPEVSTLRLNSKNEIRSNFLFAQE